MLAEIGFASSYQEGKSHRIHVTNGTWSHDQKWARPGPWWKQMGPSMQPFAKLLWPLVVVVVSAAVHSQEAVSSVDNESNSVILSQGEGDTTKLSADYNKWRCRLLLRKMSQSTSELPQQVRLHPCQQSGQQTEFPSRFYSTENCYHTFNAK